MEEELTVSSYNNTITLARRCGLLDDGDGIFKNLGIEGLPESPCESLAPVIKNRKEAKRLADACDAIPALSEEVDRIFAKSRKNPCVANPVQYIVMTDSQDFRKQACDVIVGSLHAVGRIRMRRVVSLIQGNDDAPKRFRFFSTNGDLHNVDEWYRMNHGGSVILRPVGEKEQNGAARVVGSDWMEELLRLVAIHHSETLTILLLGKEDNKLLEKIRTELSGIRFVILREKSFSTEEAFLYLKMRTKRDNIAMNEALANTLKGKVTGWDLSELDAIYGKWFDKMLCSEVYPQYGSFSPAYEAPPEKPKGDAWKDLSSLIGLASVKEVITRIVDYQKASVLYKDQGFTGQSISRHMVFTGNPGTAKTTVARLFAQIMKDNGVLREGKLVEVGRGDIVSRYLGGTAPLIKELFKGASGSVLFIDEAYSLVDGQNGLYGDEAINTIVQEMENHRDDTIVIFAGYPDKMEEFLSRNPGLKSRIAFHVQFPDYTVGELLDILSFIAGNDGVRLSEGAEAKAGELIALAAGNPDFGNGRFVRNLYEQARMCQMQRVMRLPQDDVTPEDLHVLQEDDLKLSTPSVDGQEKRRIGFGQ